MQTLILIAAFILASIAMGVVLYFAARCQRWDAMRRMIFLRFGDGVSKPWLLEMLFSNSPRFCFRYRSIPCRLKIRSAGVIRRNPVNISLTVDWPAGSKWRKSWLISKGDSHPGRWFQRPLVLHGATAFHRHFSVYGHDECDLAKIITPPVQHALLQLLQGDWLGENSTEAVSLNLSSSRGRLRFRKTSDRSAPGDVEKFVRCCLHIYDQMVLSIVEGVDYLDNDLTIIESVVCPVCSGAIEDDLVLCRSCQSPHCRDCWQYNGRCATFACLETDFVIGGSPLAQLVDSVD